MGHDLKMIKMLGWYIRVKVFKVAKKIGNVVFTK